PAAPDVDREPDTHADAGRCEPEVPAEQLTERAADQRREDGSEVDADIVDAERRVAARVVRRVEVTNLAGQAWQEKTVADRNGREGRIEECRERHHEMADGHDR